MLKTKITRAALLLAAALSIACFASCGGDDDDDDDDDKQTEVVQGNTEIEDAAETLPDSTLIPVSTTVSVTAPAAVGKIAMDGTEYSTIQAALDKLMSDSDTGAHTITLESGTYEEMLFYTGGATITIEGKGSAEYGTDVLIKAENSGNSNAMTDLAKSHNVTNGYFRGATRFDGTCSLILKNLTIQNTYSRSKKDGSNTQAEALVFSSTGNMIAYNCSFLGHQDTFYLGQKGGRMWFYKDYIRGDVDFLWGYADVALFEECLLNITYDDGASNGYIFASRTVEENDVNKGFVLMNSYVQVDEGIKAYYGRNSGSDTTAAVINNVFSRAVEGTLWGTAASKILDAAGDAASAYKDRNNAVGSEIISDSGRLANTFKMTDRVLKREYNGRYAILNRGFDVNEKTYHAAKEEWDISAYETEFNATADKSKANVYVEPVYSENVIGGATVQLSGASVISGVTYTYSSSDENIATVDANGLVTAKTSANGIVKITMTGSNGSTDVSYVKVIPSEIQATAVNVSVADASVALYGITTATVKFEPENATNQEFSLTSSDENVLFYDTGSNSLVSSLNAEVKDGKAEVFVWVGGDVSSVTLTAKSMKYESATAGTATISRKANCTTWDAQPGSYRVATDIQSGKAGVWDGLVIDSLATHSDLIKENGKMSLKSYPKMQTRNVTLYIPVEGASKVAINLASGSTGCSYKVGGDANAAFTANDGNTSFTYEYDGGSTGIVNGSELNTKVTDFQKKTSDIDTSAKYLRVDVVKDSGDVYITSIDLEKTGEFKSE